MNRNPRTQENSIHDMLLRNAIFRAGTPEGVNDATLATLEFFKNVEEFELTFSENLMVAGALNAGLYHFATCSDLDPKEFTWITLEDILQSGAMCHECLSKIALYHISGATSKRTFMRIDLMRIMLTLKKCKENPDGFREVKTYPELKEAVLLWEELTAFQMEYDIVFVENKTFKKFKKEKRLKQKKLEKLAHKFKDALINELNIAPERESASFLVLLEEDTDNTEFGDFIKRSELPLEDQVLSVERENEANFVNFMLEVIIGQKARFVSDKKIVQVNGAVFAVLKEKYEILDWYATDVNEEEMETLAKLVEIHLANANPKPLTASITTYKNL